MADSLDEYKLQLQQVEAALTSDPGNEDLLKLQKDLSEVIALTEELVHAPKEDLSADNNDKAVEDIFSGSQHARNEPINVQHTHPAAMPYKWKVGDSCIAIWSEDNQEYEARIDEIEDDGSCTITFLEYGNKDVTQLALIKPLESRSGTGGSKKQLSKREKMIEQREYKKRKNEKKRLRQKQLEEEREGEKNKWLAFNAKTFSKTSKGRVKKSIFATPDAVTGKVGVGTCGYGGKPMTKFTTNDVKHVAKKS